jgi:hypothetical protein
MGLVDSSGHHLPLDLYCDDHDAPEILDQEEDIEGQAELGYGSGVQPGRLWAGVRDSLRREWKAVHASWSGVASRLSSSYRKMFVIGYVTLGGFLVGISNEVKFLRP